MTIEIGPRSKQMLLYNDAVLYIFCLGEGWRLPTIQEHNSYDIEWSWVGDDDSENHQKWYVTPVRNKT